MNLRTIIYTTYGSRFFEYDFPAIYRTLRQAKGLTVHPFEVRIITLPQSVPTYEPGDGGRYIEWAWIRQNCPADGANTVCLHIGPKDRDRLALRHPEPGKTLGGAYDTGIGDETLDFMVVAASGGAFIRLFCHEISHGLAHWTGVPDLTHHYDYVRRNVPAIFATYDLRRWSLLKQLTALLTAFRNHLSMGKTNTQKLYDAAIAALGTDASPSDLAPDELGCAETVSSIIGKVIDFPVITGTWTLWERLLMDKRFEEVADSPRAGDIVLSPTEPRRPFPGHTGIFLDDRLIASNDSRTGLFQQNFTLARWQGYYGTKGGYPTYIYRLKN